MTSAPPPHRLRSALVWALKIVVSAGLLYFLLRGQDIGDMWDTARSASPIWFVAALAINTVVTCLGVWRWQLLLRVQRFRIRYPTLMSSFLVAAFFTNFLPSNIGGDVVRIRDSAKITGSKTVSTTVVLLDRVIGLLALVLIAAIGATLAARLGEMNGPVRAWMLWVALAGGVLAGSPFVLAPDRIGQLLRPLRSLHPEWFGDRISRFTTVLARFRSSPRTLLTCFVTAVCIQTLLVVFYAAVAYGLGVSVSFMHLAVLIPLSLVVQMLPLSVNGWGIREGTFALYLVPLGVTRTDAVLLSATGALILILFSTSGAVALVVRRRVEHHELHG